MVDAKLCVGPGLIDDDFLCYLVNRHQICCISHGCVGLGLIDDDFGMELLVAGSIINLSLPVKQVFELFWKQSPAASAPAQASAGASQASPNRADQEPIGPAMVVTFRLQASTAKLWTESVPICADACSSRWNKHWGT